MWYFLLLYRCKCRMVNAEVFESLNGILSRRGLFSRQYYFPNTMCRISPRKTKPCIRHRCIAFCERVTRFVYGNWRHTSVIVCVNRYVCRRGFVFELDSPRKFSETSPPASYRIHVVWFSLFVYMFINNDNSNALLISWPTRRALTFRRNSSNPYRKRSTVYTAQRWPLRKLRICSHLEVNRIDKKTDGLLQKVYY